MSIPSIGRVNSVYGKTERISEKASDLVDKIAADGCYTYYAKVIKDVEIKESPLLSNSV